MKPTPSKTETTTRCSAQEPNPSDGAVATRRLRAPALLLLGNPHPALSGGWTTRSKIMRKKKKRTKIKPFIFVAESGHFGNREGMLRAVATGLLFGVASANRPAELHDADYLLSLTSNPGSAGKLLTSSLSFGGFIF